MELLTQGELLRLVIVSLLSGMALGIVYDVFKVIRVFREKTKNEKKPHPVMKWAGHILCFIEDIAFFLIVSIVGVLLFSAYGAGRVRLDSIALQIISFTAWQMSVGRFTRPAAVFVKGWLGKIFCFIYKKTLLPVGKMAEARIDKIASARLDRKISSYSKKEKAKIKEKFGVPVAKNKEERTKNGKKQ